MKMDRHCSSLGEHRETRFELCKETLGIIGSCERDQVCDIICPREAQLRDKGWTKKEV